MRFSQASILAIAGLASAKDVFDWVEEFSTIAPNNTQAFTSWREGYEDAYKSMIKSYFEDQPSQKGFATAEASSLESSLLADADQDKTRDYGYFYSEFFPNSTIDIYATGDYSDFFTGTEDFFTGTEDFYETSYETGSYETEYETGVYETEPYETGAYDTASYANHNSTVSSTPVTHSTAVSHHSYVPKNSTSQVSHSPVKFAARDVPSSTGFTTILTGTSAKITSGISSPGSSSGLHGSSTNKTLNGTASGTYGNSSHASSSAYSSSAHSASSSGIGGHHAPVILGAALAGLSVLVL